MGIMTVIYSLVACFGYACLGDATPYNILTGQRQARGAAAARSARGVAVVARLLTSLWMATPSHQRNDSPCPRAGPFGNGWQPQQVPRWVIALANVAVFLRTVPAYQIYR